MIIPALTGYPWAIKSLPAQRKLFIFLKKLSSTCCFNSHTGDAAESGHLEIRTINLEVQ